MKNVKFQQLWRKGCVNSPNKSGQISYLYANFARKCVVFRKKLHSWKIFYTTASRDGRDKFQVCMRNFSLYEFPDNIQILSCQSKYLFRANFETTFPLKFRFRAKCVKCEEWKQPGSRRQICEICCAGLKYTI